ncbi:PQQ-binding-like beta-propeller repeat protein [Streptomyces sp. NPDC047130]|uniref:outer membrane protein assembly factor BamB family protein n=1 Tax=Streptomyces sp. NPDC047130 TaxID=3155261 RepID=UPI003404A41C
MPNNQTVPDTGPSRRRMLRLSGGGLALAALGAGASGCREDVPDDPDTGDGADQPGSADPSGGISREDEQAPTPLWTRTTSATTYGNNDELVAVDDVVITSGDPLTALDTKTGEPKWSQQDGAIPGAPLLLGNNTLYLASSKYDGTVGGYEPASGKEVWRSRLGKAYRQPRPVAVDGQQVYVVAEILEADGSSHTNVIAALDSGTGKVAWREQRDPGTEQNGIHAAVQGRHLVYTDFRKNLTVRDTVTGQQVWTRKTTQTNWVSFAVHQDLVIVPQGRKLQAFRLSDGSEKWSVETEAYGSFKVPAVVEGVLHVADSGKTLRALEPQTGREIWQSTALADAGVHEPWQFVKAGGTLYGATQLDEGGGVHAIDAKTGELLWTFNDKSGDHHAWLVATDGKRVFALHGKKLHALPA